MDVSRSRDTLHETLTTGEIKAMFAGSQLKRKYKSWLSYTDEFIPRAVQS